MKRTKRLYNLLILHRKYIKHTGYIFLEYERKEHADVIKALKKAQTDGVIDGYEVFLAKDIIPTVKVLFTPMYEKIYSQLKNGLLENKDKWVAYGHGEWNEDYKLYEKACAQLAEEFKNRTPERIVIYPIHDVPVIYYKFNPEI